MRVLVLHSDVGPDAPPDDLDTLLTADAVRGALEARGHGVHAAPFGADARSLDRLLAETRPDAVFNLVESVFGQGELAAVAPAMLGHQRVAYTGAGAAALALAADKILTKRLLVSAGLPTPPWSEPPTWKELVDGVPYVVKSATEDASLGLDEGSVVTGREAVRRRVLLCSERHGGRWFAETFMPGREFNVALLQGPSGPLVLPIAEMKFENWPADRPRLVGYAAKWDPSSDESMATVRSFDLEGERHLLDELGTIAHRAWDLFALQGYARIDFRLDAAGRPMVLEINPNPCLEPDAGFASAAARAGLAYAELVDRILLAATAAS